MELKEALEKKINIYWWNFGKKTLDFKGTYKEFLKEKGITVSKRKNSGLSFKIPVGSSMITLKTTGYNWVNDLDDAIKLFLTCLGDKTLFNGCFKIFRLNW